MAVNTATRTTTQLTRPLLRFAIDRRPRQARDQRHIAEGWFNLRLVVTCPLPSLRQRAGQALVDAGLFFAVLPSHSERIRYCIRPRLSSSRHGDQVSSDRPVSLRLRRECRAASILLMMQRRKVGAACCKGHAWLRPETIRTTIFCVGCRNAENGVGDEHFASDVRSLRCPHRPSAR
jgi:hypothetical protein